MTNFLVPFLSIGNKPLEYPREEDSHAYSVSTKEELLDWVKNGDQMYRDLLVPVCVLASSPSSAFRYKSYADFLLIILDFRIAVTSVWPQPSANRVIHRIGKHIGGVERVKIGRYTILHVIDIAMSLPSHLPLATHGSVFESEVSNHKWNGNWAILVSMRQGNSVTSQNAISKWMAQVWLGGDAKSLFLQYSVFLFSLHSVVSYLSSPLITIIDQFKPDVRLHGYMVIHWVKQIYCDDLRDEPVPSECPTEIRTTYQAVRAKGHSETLDETWLRSHQAKGHSGRLDETRLRSHQAKGHLGMLDERPATRLHLHWAILLNR
ncbi:hypothetical protein EDB85DRAFT_1897205 [Lactarius pseudohatsudake]|nr:hypothetical protein EDB85DRAFT_1897205 [Lactarius pseudohatsudake]